MTSSGHATIRAGSAIVVVIFQGNTLLADGYNRINEVAVPALVIIFALLYFAIALAPSALVHLCIKKAAPEHTPRFGRSYLGAVAGGEAGIGLSYAISQWWADPGWSSYHYTLYPYLILGLSVAAAVLLSLTGSRKL